MEPIGKQLQQTGILDIASGARPAQTDDGRDTSGVTASMRQAREITGLGSMSPEYVFEEFAKLAPEGTLHRVAFVTCFQRLMAPVSYTHLTLPTIYSV